MNTRTRYVLVLARKSHLYATYQQAYNAQQRYLSRHHITLTILELLIYTTV